MPIFQGGAVTQATITGAVQGALLNLRRALEQVADLHSWISAYSAADLEAVPFSFSAADAQDILNALADAAELNTLYNGGGLGTYTLPYNFSNSQRVVIGPLY
jgi:hypothetical protein